MSPFPRKLLETLRPDGSVCNCSPLKGPFINYIATNFHPTSPPPSVANRSFNPKYNTQKNFPAAGEKQLGVFLCEKGASYTHFYTAPPQAFLSAFSGTFAAYIIPRIFLSAFVLFSRIWWKNAPCGGRETEKICFFNSTFFSLSIFFKKRGIQKLINFFFLSVRW
jgi:hypothetical protein